MGKIFHHTPPYRVYSEWGSYPMVYCVTGSDFTARTLYTCAFCATEIKHADPSAEVIGHAMESQTDTIECEVWNCTFIIVDASDYAEDDAETET
jgi:hypothetical protein